MKITNQEENRETDRIPHMAVIRYSAGDQDEYRTARMFNFSRAGMYLEINYPPPKLGANLLIEVLDQNDAVTDPMIENRSTKTCYYAKVIWKKNLPKSDAEYGVGLRYLFAANPEG